MTRRAIAVMAMLAMGLLAAPQAEAATTKVVPIKGTDWFWESQERQEIEPSCPPELPACPAAQPALPNPHEGGAIPVQIQQGADEKISGILFDLEFLPSQGATISKFAFTVTESPDNRDKAQMVGSEGKKILACLITAPWTEAEDGASQWKDRPEFTCDNAVEGTRIENPEPGDQPFLWKFDITPLVADWGKPQDDREAYGVMLTGKKLPAGESWQIVLKGPRRDDPATTDNPNTPNNENVDEAELNKSNIQASITYTPKPKPKPPTNAPPPTNTPPPTTGGFTGSPTDTGTFPSFGETPIPSDAPVFPDPTTVAPIPPIAAPPTVATSKQGPSTPGYFWLFLPLALIGLSVARAAVLEPVAGRRPDGVVALIRRHNAARRGLPSAPDAVSPIAGITRAVRSAGAGIRSFFRRVVTGGTP